MIFLKGLWANIKHLLKLSDLYYSGELVTLFKQYNKKYFNGVLPVIPIYVDNAMYAWGKFMAQPYLEERIMKPSHILINLHKVNNEEDLLNTLVHEMVHYYETLFHSYITDDIWRQANNYYEDYLMAVELDDSNPERFLDRITKILFIPHTDYFKEVCHELNTKHKELCLKVTGSGERL